MRCSLCLFNYKLCNEFTSEAKICLDCFTNIVVISDKNCKICKDDVNLSYDICFRCKNERPNFEKLYCCLAYAEPIKSLYKAFKFQKYLNLAGIFAFFLKATLRGVSADCIIPIPLHKTREKERGFNQVVEILKKYSQLNNTIPVLYHALKRIKYTDAQTLSNNSFIRKNNLENAFISNIDLTGLNIILVDDIITSGATLINATRALQKAGATQIRATAILRTTKTTNHNHYL